MQIKTNRRCHFTPIRTVTINKADNKKCWWGCRELGPLIYWWWESKMAQPLWKTTWQFLKKLNIKLPNDAAIPLPDIYTSKVKTCLHQDWYRNVHSSIIHNSPKLETIWMSINWWMDILNVEYHLTIKKKY